MSAKNRWFFRAFCLCGFAVLASFGGCSTPSAGNGNSNTGDSAVLIPETTKSFSNTDLDALTSVEGDLATLEFSQETAMLAGLSNGDVIVSDVHGSMLPGGMLRRVTGIDRSGGTVRLTTEQAALTDAIERGSLNETITLDADNIVTRTGNAKAGLETKIIQIEDVAGLVFAFNDYELYDADGNPATREDRVWLDGNFSFLPTLGFELDIDGFELKKLVFEIGSDQQVGIQVSAGREATFSKTEVIETITLTPITFSIGPVPVVLIPQIIFRVGVDGTVTADLTAGVQADATVSVGFGYQNGEWGPVSEFDTDASFDAANFRDGVSGTAKVWAGARAELSAYGIAGVYGEVRGFVRADVDGAADPWWSLSAGAEALAGAFLEVLDITIADYETDPFTASVNLADAGGPAPAGGSEVIAWARSFAGGEDDNTENPCVVLAAPDGGSLVVGGTSSFTSGARDTWLIKLDRLGQVSWQTAIEDVGNAVGAAQLPGGGYVVLVSNVGTGANEFKLVHVDENGAPVWGYLYESDQSIGGYGLVLADDQLVVGGLYGSGAGSDCLLSAFDLDGQVLWANAIGGDEGDQVDGMAVDADGAIIVTGPTHSFDVSFNGHWVVKFGSDGEPIWQYSFDGNGNEWAHSVVADSEGNYKIVGRTGNNALVSKLDGAGQLLSASVYDTGSPYEEAFAALGTPEDGLLIAGNTGLASDSDIWLLRLTPELEVLWTTSYGGPGKDEAGGTIQYGAVSTPLAVTEDKGYLVLANTQSFGESFSDLWIQKVSETGTLTYDTGSSAVRTSLAGSYEDYELTQTATNEEATEVSLTRTPLELTTYTPTPVITTQASP